MIQLKAIVIAATASLGALAAAFSLSAFLHSTAAADSNALMESNAPPHEVALANQEPGHKLFDRNCAHCHGDDARGDEGPNLHNLKLSDARITKRIKEGIKGEMPSFGSKLDDRDIQSLIAYLRTLKD
jgi:mono/diheme cytochrome c family protein